MEQDFSMQIIALREDHVKYPGIELIRSRRCISCSKDNQIIICGATTIYIIDLMVSQDLRSDRDLLSTKMYTTSHLSTLTPFSFTAGLLNTRNSVLHITEEQRQTLITDATLYSYPSSCHITIPADTFSCALPSPVSHNSKHRPLLAALTTGYRIIFYEEGQQEWNLVCEMSELLYQLLCSHLEPPLTLGKTISFDDYVNLCHSMSTVELQWSPVFSPLAGDKSSPFYLFFTATKSGSIHVWKVPVALKTNEDIEFVSTHTGSRAVTGMSWLSLKPHTGVLAVGQFDGSVSVLQVTCGQCGSLVEVLETFSEPQPDNLAVVKLDWATMEDGTVCLVVCKEYYVLLYTYVDNCLVFMEHIRVEGCLPISGLSMHGTRGALCTVDSHMYNIECDGEDGKACLSLTKMKPLSLPVFTEVEYLSYGLCLSPHGMVCFSVHRPNRNFTKNTKRLVLDTYKVTLTAPFAYSVDSVLSSMVQHSLTGFSDVQPSIQDILMLQKLHLRDIDYADEVFEEVTSVYEELSESKDVSVLHIVRNLLLYTKQCFLQRGFLSEKEVDWLEETTDSTTRDMLSRHVRESYSRLPASPSIQDLTILASMKQWAVSCQLSDCVPEGLIVRLEERFPQIKEIQRETCSICGESLQFDNRLQMKCSKGHKMKSCCLTFLPCQMRDARHCNICSHPAVPIAYITDSVLIDRPDTCSLCGGRLINKFL